MTNYLTSVGVQQFSITIASGSTTGTATITAVGTGAFIIYGGVNSSASDNPSENYAYLTKTNSTTITATRNTGTAGTVVVTGCIIDGDTTNLIKSIQYGTVTIADTAATGTVSISAVTNGNTALHWLGMSTAATAYGAGNQGIILSLSGTTVTATRNSTSGAVTVGFVAIEFQGAALKQSTQNVSAVSSGTVSTWTATITSVNTNNAILLSAGPGEYAGSQARPNSTFYYGQLTNATTVTATASTANSTVKTWNGTVVEFVSGVLHSNVQRSTTALSAATSGTSTITSVVKGNSGISFLGNIDTSNSTATLNADLAQVVLTNSTTVTTTLNTSGTITSSWEVFEFPAFSGGGQTLNTIWFGAIT